MSKVFLTPLLPFVSACLYGDAASFYAHLNEAERTELESQGKTLGMTAWFYRYLLDVLPEGKRQAFQKVYWLRKVRALSEEHELNRLCSVLRKSGLRFALIKGADLAYRLYPDPALRPHGDWDIWFHPDDCELALEKLAEDNWDTSVQYTDHQVFSEVFDAARKINEHHFFPHVRGGYIVEPHFTLPNFANVDPHELWAYTVEYREGGQHILSPELNLLMLTRHVASKAYFHANIPKLLTDAAVVMQGETVDFAMLCEMAARWRLPYSGDLLAAFREFFPSDVVSGFRADPEETSRFRTLFEKRAALDKPQNISLEMNWSHAKGKSIQILWDHVRNGGPKKMRCWYHLPKRGAWLRVGWAFVRYYCSQIWGVVCSELRHDKALRDYCIMVEDLESNAAAKRKI